MLIALGCPPGEPVRGVLDANLHPETVRYTDDPFEVTDTLLEYPNAVLAYGPGRFAQLTTSQGVLFTMAKRTVLLTFAYRPDPDAAADVVQQAARVAGCTTILDLNYPDAVQWLATEVLK